MYRGFFGGFFFVFFGNVCDGSKIKVGQLCLINSSKIILVYFESFFFFSFFSLSHKIRCTQRNDKALSMDMQHPKKSLRCIAGDG